MEISALKKRLVSNIEDVCTTLLPSGQKLNNEYVCGSTDGESGKSLKVRLSGIKAGSWADFAGDESGDVIDLIRSAKGYSLPEALGWAESFLGVERVTSKPSPRKYKLARLKPGAKGASGPVLDYLVNARKFTPEVIAKFRMGGIESEPVAFSDGETRETPVVIYPYFDPHDSKKLHNIKYKATLRDSKGKKAMWTSKDARPTLFGWQALDANAREVLIVEGEENCISWTEYGFSALAAPFGAGAAGKHAWVEAEFDNLERFETIYLNFDPDAPGQMALKDLPDRLGRHRVKIVPPLPHKDANDCLKAGVPREVLAELVAKARTCDPPQFRLNTDYRSDVMKLFYPSTDEEQGFALPFIHGCEEMQKFRLRLGEMSLWTGYQHHGKTTMLNLMMFHIAKAGEMVVINSLEVKPSRSLEVLVRQCTGQKQPDPKYIDETLQWLDEKMWFIDAQGASKLDDIITHWDYARKRYGARWFVIDSLMKLGMGPDDYAGQKATVERLHTWAMTNNCHVALVAHPRKGINDFNPPTAMDIAGIGDICNIVDTILVTYKNRPKLMKIAKHKSGQRVPDINKIFDEFDGKLIKEKERNGDGEAWELSLWYDYDSRQYRDFKKVQVRPLLDYTDMPEFVDTEPDSAEKEEDEFSGEISYIEDEDFKF